MAACSRALSVRITLAARIASAATQIIATGITITMTPSRNRSAPLWAVGTLRKYHPDRQTQTTLTTMAAISMPVTPSASLRA